MRILKLVGFNIIIVASCILCYSPGFLNLYFDGLTTRGILFICSVLLIAGTFIIVNEALLKPKTNNYYFNPADNKAYSIEEVLDVLEDLALNDKSIRKKRDKVVLAIGVADNAIRNAQSSVKLLFEEGSVSYSRYTSTIVECSNAMSKDFMIIYNNLQRTDSLSLVSEENIAIRKSDIAKIDGLLDDIEAMSGRLETFARQLETDKSETDDEYLIEEIQRLGKEAKYYM